MHTTSVKKHKVRSTDVHLKSKEHHPQWARLRTAFDGLGMAAELTCLLCSMPEDYCLGCWSRDFPAYKVPHAPKAAGKEALTVAESQECGRWELEGRRRLGTEIRRAAMELSLPYRQAW